MKPRPIPFLICALIVGPVAAQAAPGNTLLTFDDVTSAPFTTTMPNGYGGLQWLGFGVISGTQFSSTAYNPAMVSPNYVAYNSDEFDRRAYLSSSTAFNLDSAYLTSGIYAPMQVEVQGFVDGRLTYDNTYALSANGPTLVNFNYLGVDSVEFLPQLPGSTYVSDAYIFAMDNLSIGAVPEPRTGVLFVVGVALAGWSIRRKNSKVLSVR